MKEPKVGIVVVHFGSLDGTLRCLNSLRALRSPAPRIVVVDNDPSNRLPQEPAAAFSVTVIKSGENRGFAAGCNLGIKEVLKHGGDYVLLVNNDVEVAPRLLRSLCEPFGEDATIGITGPLITYQRDPQKIWFAGGYFNRTFCFTRHPYMGKTLNQTSPSRVVDFITGCCMLIRREVFEEIGLLDEDYFLYFEDLDFCWRAKEAGFKSFLVAEPLVKHETSDRFSPQKAYYFARNPLIFIKKNTSGFNTVTSLLGQFLVRFPYYLQLFVRCKDFRALGAYLRGLGAVLGRGLYPKPATSVDL